jgi:hypothetical protein
MAARISAGILGSLPTETQGHPYRAAPYSAHGRPSGKPTGRLLHKAGRFFRPA